MRELNSDNKDLNNILEISLLILYKKFHWLCGSRVITDEKSYKEGHLEVRGKVRGNARPHNCLISHFVYLEKSAHKIIS